MSTIRAKKHFGQHFLCDPNICKKITLQYSYHKNCRRVIEVGPGMGALTEALLQLSPSLDLFLMEIDPEACRYLKTHFPNIENKIIQTDFLKTNLQHYVGGENFAVVGNFPYNISSQILFKCLEFRNQIPEIVGMFQKEVAERIAERPGSKQYGILSVLMQAFYDIRYCFTVDEHLFIPPPKVKSGVIQCVRNTQEKLPCNEELFFKIVKLSFNQRRKIIRNSLKAIIHHLNIEHPYLSLRPETLSVEQFVELTNLVEHNIKG